MKGDGRLQRLQRVRRSESGRAAARLREASDILRAAQAAVEERRRARQDSEEAAASLGSRPQSAADWLAQRTVVQDRLEAERLAEIQARRLGRQEAVRRLELRQARVREEQIDTLQGDYARSDRALSQRADQREIDDLRGEGGGGR